MTVRELIEKLNEMPQEAEVFSSTDERGCRYSRYNEVDELGFMHEIEMPFTPHGLFGKIRTVPVCNSCRFCKERSDAC